MTDAHQLDAEEADARPRSLLALLDLTPIGSDTWTGPTPAEGPGRLFGGQVAAQALRAACNTVDPGPRVHSLHGYFIRPGRPHTDLELHVERTRDGRSFTTRHVTAVQEGRAIFELTASFHTDEQGVDWQEAPPPIGDPEDAPEPFVGPFNKWQPSNPFIIRPVARERDVFSLHPCWIKLREEVGDDPHLHACALTFISDIALVSAARAPGKAAIPSGASLDHAVWFHRPPNANDWHLYSAASVTNYGARGLARGTMHSRDGRLIASVTQEALLRPSGNYQMPPGMAEMLARENLA
jgi:acyl-CoA thioesterase-2